MLTTNTVHAKAENNNPQTKPFKNSIFFTSFTFKSPKLYPINWQLVVLLR